MSAGTESPAERPPLALALFVLLCLGIAVATMTLFAVSNNDIWLHLRTAQWILDHGSLPVLDPYSYTASDRPYVTHEWALALLFYAAHSLAGIPGMIGLKAAIIAVALAFLFAAARSLGARPVVILALTPWLLYVASARFLVRPHIISYALAAVMIWLLVEYRRRGRPRAWLAGVVVTHGLWVNLHGGYVHGVAILGIFCLAELLAWLRQRRIGDPSGDAPTARQLLWVAATLPACLVVTPLNPNGLQMLSFPFELPGMEIFVERILEWQPPFASTYNRTTMFVGYGLWLTLVTAAFIGRWGEPGRSPVARLNRALLVATCLLLLLALALWLSGPEALWRPAVVRALLVALLAIFLVAVAASWRRIDFVQAGWAALFFAVSLRHSREVTDAVLGTFPILAALLSSLAASRWPSAPGPAPWLDLSPRRGALLAGGLLLATSVHVCSEGYRFDFAGATRPAGLRVANTMPGCALEFIDSRQLSGRAFVSFGYGAPLLYRAFPRVSVNVDSRADVYGETLYRAHLAALADPQAMLAYVERYAVDFFFLTFADRDPAVFAALAATGDWVPVYYDMGSFILVRRSAASAALIATEAFEILRPRSFGRTSVTADNAERALVEARRAIASCPGSRFGRIFEFQILALLGRHREALVANQALLALAPADAWIWMARGDLYRALDEPDEAAAMYERALELDPSRQGASERLRQLQGP